MNAGGFLVGLLIKDSGDSELTGWVVAYSAGELGNTYFGEVNCGLSTHTRCCVLVGRAMD